MPLASFGVREKVRCVSHILLSYIMAHLHNLHERRCLRLSRGSWVRPHDGTVEYGFEGRMDLKRQQHRLAGLHSLDISGAPQLDCLESIPSVSGLP